MNGTHSTNVRLTGSDVVKYRNRLYSVRWTSDIHGYFLAPIKGGDENLGFWAPAAKCISLKN